MENGKKTAGHAFEALHLAMSKLKDTLAQSRADAQVKVTEELLAGLAASLKARRSNDGVEPEAQTPDEPAARAETELEALARLIDGKV